MVLSEESVGAFCFVLTTKVTSPPPPPQNPWVGAFFAIAFLAPNGSLCLMWKRQLVRAGRSRSCYEHCTRALHEWDGDRDRITRSRTKACIRKQGTFVTVHVSRALSFDVF